MKKRILLGICVAVLFVAGEYGDEKGTVDTGAFTDLAPPVTTTHQVVMEGKTVKYRATVGYLEQCLDAKSRAAFFYTAYMAEPETEAPRPLTFCFNGGPGSSSFYLHLLAIGPRRAVLSPEGDTLPPPPRLADNPHSWLAATDIVMVDPVGTGFSRRAPKTDGKAFWGVREDARSVADFIRMYLTENDRWLSPLYIAGESYGGIRGAVLARELQEAGGIGLDLNGLIYISPALAMQYVWARDYNAMGLALFFPTYCTTAGYHGRVGEPYREDPEALGRAARTFAVEKYLPALLQGPALKPSEMERLATEMSELCGLPVSYLVSQKLRVTPEEFRERLRKDEQFIIDRIDGRFRQGRYSLTRTLSPLINHYLRSELGYGTSLPYTHTASLFLQWKWDFMEPSVMGCLADVMNRNPYLKVFCAAGFYDFACPFAVIDYCLDQLPLRGKREGRIQRRYYPTGHMVYTPIKELAAFNGDVKEFIRRTSRRESQEK